MRLPSHCRPLRTSVLIDGEEALDSRAKIYGPQNHLVEQPRVRAGLLPDSLPREFLNQGCDRTAIPSSQGFGLLEGLGRKNFKRDPGVENRSG